jgi:hypothetical protein
MLRSTPAESACFGRQLRSDYHTFVSATSAGRLRRNQKRKTDLTTEATKVAKFRTKISDTFVTFAVSVVQMSFVKRGIHDE